MSDLPADDEVRPWRGARHGRVQPLRRRNPQRAVAESGSEAAGAGGADVAGSGRRRGAEQLLAEYGQHCETLAEYAELHSAATRVVADAAAMDAKLAERRKRARY